jgi:hypothetical protein
VQNAKAREQRVKFPADGDFAFLAIRGRRGLTMRFERPNSLKRTSISDVPACFDRIAPSETDKVIADSTFQFVILVIAIESAWEFAAIPVFETAFRETVWMIEVFRKTRKLACAT